MKNSRPRPKEEMERRKRNEEKRFGGKGEPHRFQTYKGRVYIGHHQEEPSILSTGDPHL